MNPLEPMLATEYISESQITYPCFVQPKLDGIRAVWTEGKLWSRGLVGGKQKVFSDKVLAHIYKELRASHPDTKLDGELYVHGWSLQRINAAAGVNRKTPTEDSTLIQYHIYDIPSEESFADRFYYRSHAVGLPFVLVPANRVVSWQQADEHFDEFIKLAYEGMIYRVGRCTYQPGKRSTQLIKRKLWKDCIGKVVAYNKGEGRLSKTLGAVVAMVTELDCVVTVGSGFTDRQRKILWEHKPKELWIKIRYERLTDSGAPYKPTLIEFIQ